MNCILLYNTVYFSPLQGKNKLCELEWLGTVITQKPYRLVQIGIVSARNRINNFPPREPSSAALNVLCMNAVCVLQAAVA